MNCKSTTVMSRPCAAVAALKALWRPVSTLTFTLLTPGTAAFLIALTSFLWRRAYTGLSTRRHQYPERSWRRQDRFTVPRHHHRLGPDWLSFRSHTQGRRPLNEAVSGLQGHNRPRWPPMRMTPSRPSGLSLLGVVSPNRRNLSRGNLPPGTVGFLPGSMLFTDG